jgi:hypothetical protein
MAQQLGRIEEVDDDLSTDVTSDLETEVDEEILPTPSFISR